MARPRSNFTLSLAESRRAHCARWNERRLRAPRQDQAAASTSPVPRGDGGDNEHYGHVACERRGTMRWPRIW